MRFAALCLLAVLLTCPLLVFGEDSGDTKPLEMPDFSKVSTAPSEKKGISVETTCTTSTGRTLNKSDAGYESCVSASQMELSNRMKSKSDSNEGPATGVKFKIGN